MAELGQGEGRVGRITCAGCGLLCDDVTVVDAGEQPVRLDPECPLGAQWLTDRLRLAPEPRATIDGRLAEPESAIARAGDLLRASRRPLVYGFDGATVEDARAAVALADRVGALVATEELAGPWPGTDAVALRGASTATLGEIRDRSRVVIIWREDPETTHPRLLQRLGLGAGSGRTVIVVDDRATATARRADLRAQWGAESDLAALVALHTMVHRPPAAPTALDDRLRDLLEHLRAVDHIAIVHGRGLASGSGGQRRVLALHELVRALSQERHVVTLALPRAAGLRGAQDALTWQTGYGGTVDLAPGHPLQVTGTRPVATGLGVDVAVRVEAAAASVPGHVAEIVLGHRTPDGEAAVWIRTAAAGVEAGGTAHRLDGVPLALQSPRAGDAPPAADVLERLRAEVTR